ncbi:Putative Conidial pigment biosynthesis protein Ayg1 (AFU_orthologue; AFUA_2G17550) [Aspergillus calidoustus]|uniref:Putative Conidial pigment biosynthesis protein Ayg1 (AFU_orthologue AFUA_2G17550) n=1 Tax=Aspergillus calidoustus TaxID=454130 RepID=A0A0U5G4B3_ASPCI|nr:Putative Conidial pigment biosynthesis protein Ayg1 (AFU_orthologue; AFUA_2G17550) [Aspergillus calidoustus]
MGWILGDKFDTVYPHKGSIRILWETRWKIACERSVYPFHDGNIKDFEPIFEHLIKHNINDASSDEYTKAFLPVADSLEQRASTALENGDSQAASELLLRAAVVYRISRFPYVGPKDTGLKRDALERQKKAYIAATSFWPARIEEQLISYSHRRGNEGTHIPIYVRVPANVNAERKVPCVLILTGLDGYRPDNSQRTHEIIKRGWAVVVCEIPGTADSPADPADPESPDRLLDSVLEYMASRAEIDMSRIVIWGLSAGGFYAVRGAHTHNTRLAGCIAHGPGIHHFLDPEWLRRVEDHEYPFPIVTAWAKKYGYADPDEFRQKAQEKFSLIRTGIVDQPSCRLLLLNGMDDGVTPIEDCLVLFNHGSPKEARLYPGLPHMGYPDSLVAAYKWLDDVLGQGKCSRLPN